MYIWIFSFSPRMLHKPVATGMMHRAANPSSIWIITLSANSVLLHCKYFCWESGCYSRSGSTLSRPSWDEPKHIPCVTVYLCWQEAWATALWHFIKQITGTLSPRACGDSQSEREGGLCDFLCLHMEYTHTWTCIENIFKILVHIHYFILL